MTRDATLLVIGADNKALFDEWVRSDLNGGASWFDWVDPLTKTSKKARIVGDKYKWNEPNGAVWKASCQIETLG